MKLSVYSGKGGVGKSTIAVNLAGLYASRGLSVCVIDEDEQATLIDIYADNLCGFDVVKKLPPFKKYDLCIYDHHPSHSSIELQELVICPIRPSRFDWESYRRARAFIGQRPHVLVVNQWTARSPDDKHFISNLKTQCSTHNIDLCEIKHRNIFKRMTDDAKTVFQAENRHGANDARKEIKLLAGVIDAK